MNVSGLGSLIGSQQSQGLQKTNAKLQAVIASLVSGARGNADNVAELSIASQLQSELSSLKQVSGNIAQATSLAQVADGGVQQIQSALQELRSLAQQASSPALSEANRQQIEQQFKKISDALDQTVNGTAFNSQKLLDGSLSGDKAITLGKILSDESDNGGAELSIENLSRNALFDGKALSLSTAAGANEAVSVLANALDKVTAVRSNIGAFEKTLEYAAASIDSAVFNQEAARSILQDTDFAEGSTQLSLLNIQRNASLALQAQGNKLAPNLLGKLIG